VDDKLPRSCTHMGKMANKATALLLVWLGVDADTVGQLSGPEACKVLLWAVRLDHFTKIFFLETWCTWHVFCMLADAMPLALLIMYYSMPLRHHAAPTTLPLLLRLFRGRCLRRRPPRAKLAATSCIDSASVWPNTIQAEQQPCFLYGHDVYDVLVVLFVLHAVVIVVVVVSMVILALLLVAVAVVVVAVTGVPNLWTNLAIIIFTFPGALE
jgi:hypothetical protein